MISGSCGEKTSLKDSTLQSVTPDRSFLGLVVWQVSRIVLDDDPIKVPPAPTSDPYSILSHIDEEDTDVGGRELPSHICSRDCLCGSTSHSEEDARMRT